jgi:cytochrome c oxidase subunit 4
MAASQDATHAPDHLTAEESHVHAMPAGTLLTVFFVLVALTLLTVYAADHAPGSAEIAISLGIATVKASLVAYYFMHLRDDKPLNAMVFISSMVFLALFLILTLIDAQEYQDLLIW